MAEMKFNDPTEEWIELYVDARYLVSTKGRLYDTELREEVPLVLMQNGNTLPLWGWQIREKRAVTSTGTPTQGVRVLAAAKAVLTSFGPSGWVPVYIDGDRTNVALSNLRWTKVHAHDRVGHLLASAG